MRLSRVALKRDPQMPLGARGGKACIAQRLPGSCSIDACLTDSVVIGARRHDGTASEFSRRRGRRAPRPCGALSFRCADALHGDPRLSRIFRGCAMTTNAITRLERPSDDLPAIEALQHAAFGPGAYARAAVRVREQAPHDPKLSFMTELDGEPIGSVRMTPIRVGDADGAEGLLLGPLVVEPAFKGKGHGKALMRLVMEEARKSGWRFVILVGDQPYY